MTSHHTVQRNKATQPPGGKEEARSEKQGEVTLPWSHGAEAELGGLMRRNDQGHSLALPAWAPTVFRSPRPLQVSKQAGQVFRAPEKEEQG